MTIINQFRPVDDPAGRLVPEEVQLSVIILWTASTAVSGPHRDVGGSSRPITLRPPYGGRYSDERQPVAVVVRKLRLNRVLTVFPLDYATRLSF